MRFKSYIGKQVMIKDRSFMFSAEDYETEDQDEIKALSSALDVFEVKSTKAKSNEIAQKND